MGNDLNIVIIGAGSASFGLDTLSGLMTQKNLRESTLSLVDVNKENLDQISGLAKLANKKWNSNMEIITTTDRKQVLNNANFVILSVAVDREKTWIQDYELGLKYGIHHYAENGGPGSFSHTVRGLSFIKPILEDIHDLCPDAWLINYTNPLPRIGYAAQTFGVKCVGLCHQIWHAYGIVGRYMAKELNITDPRLLNFKFEWTDENFRLYNQFVDQAYAKYDIKAAGLNHFIWLMDIRKRGNWEDLYPQIRNKMGTINTDFEPLTQHMFRIFGLLPGPGDTHLTEYVPYTVTKENWKKYSIALYDFDWARRKRDEMWTRIRNINSGVRSFDLSQNHKERADWIIAEIYGNSNTYEHSLNIINNGTITNLPDDAIVEVPAIVNSYGICGMKIGRLPEAIAALCQREISVAKLMTKAGLDGDRNAAIQAFALDPMVNDLEKAEKMVDDYIFVHKEYLPQFFS
jgi:alpha-galactosidase